MENLNKMLPPLPERMRPHNLDEYVGQRHLVGEGCVLRNMITSGNLSSFILWGPPGVGKTTLARIIAGITKRKFYTLSAINAGVKEVREIIERAGEDKDRFSMNQRPLLFFLLMKFTDLANRSRMPFLVQWKMER